MFQTSQDLLNIVLAGAIALVAIFLAWMLAEAALAVHQWNRVVSELRRKIARIESALLGIKDKLEHSVGYLAVLAAGVKTVMEKVFGKVAGRKRKR